MNPIKDKLIGLVYLTAVFALVSAINQPKEEVGVEPTSSVFLFSDVLFI